MASRLRTDWLKPDTPTGAALLIGLHTIWQGQTLIDHYPVQQSHWLPNWPKRARKRSVFGMQIRKGHYVMAHSQ
ncbi:hypothetical protein ACTXT7_010010 [Hymenolepis weldensis]